MQINHSVAAQARGKGCGISVRAETAVYHQFQSSSVFVSCGISDVRLLVLGCVYGKERCVCDCVCVHACARVSFLGLG